MRHPQQAFRFRTHGGARPGAGRKPNGLKAGVSHVKRAPLSRRFPVHVTLRVRPEVPTLRTGRRYRAIARAFAAGHERFGFRLNHYSIQGNHLHFIVEAENKHCLARGMQGLSIRMAKRLNAVTAHQGRVFADRYHARILRTPTEVRRAVDYVVRNRERHAERAGRPLRRWVMDLYSSAVFFNAKWRRWTIDWLQLQPDEPPGDASAGTSNRRTSAAGPDLIAPPRTWLLQHARVGA